MIEHQLPIERAFLVSIVFRKRPAPPSIAELQALAHAAGAIVAGVFESSRDVPDPRTLLGTGKLEEIRLALQESPVDLVIFNNSLSPGQERNIEKILQVRVIDRTRLILDIFAKRARTFEGKLQVELAQLNHMATRLVRGWTHLERQKGGIGLRGPGETQLETDRRLLRGRIQYLQRNLARVEQQRALSRRSRERQEQKTVALVGYTNAGKSTLFNQLTGADTFIANQLFATLDPTLRVLPLPTLGSVILVDTVGFIQQLPHQLVHAFRATLEETVESSLLLHVVDVSDPNYAAAMHAVNEVLEEIGATDVPQLMVYNKVDALGQIPRVDAVGHDKPSAVWISAQTGAGMDLLKAAIVAHLSDDLIFGTLTLGPADAAARAALYTGGAVSKEQVEEDGRWTLEIKATSLFWQRCCQEYPALLTGFRQKREGVDHVLE